MRITTLAVAALCLSGWGGAVMAQSTAGAVAVCPAGASAPPVPFVGWNSRIAVQAASDISDVTTARLSMGEAADMALSPTGQVRYPVPPERSGNPDANGGLAQLSIETDGVYRVALGSGAWVDVVRDGETVASTAHGHGPACSGIRKIVDFALTKGTYVVQIADASSPRVEIMIAPAN